MGWTGRQALERALIRCHIFSSLGTQKTSAQRAAYIIAAGAFSQCKYFMIQATSPDKGA